MSSLQHTLLAFCFRQKTAQDNLEFTTVNKLSPYITWSGADPIVSTIFSTFITVGASGGKLAFYNSYDSTWYLNTDTVADSPIAIANSTNHGIIVLGNNNLARTDNSGTTWYKLDPGGSGYDKGCIIWNGSKYVSLGNYKKSMVSIDAGLTWTHYDNLPAEWATTSQVSCIMWDGSQFLAVNQGRQVATSTDGTSWTNVSPTVVISSNLGTVRGGIWTGSRFVVFGNNYVAYSTNGTSWSSISIPSWTGTIRAITKVGSTLILVGDSGQVATSTSDGQSWNYRTGLSSTTWGTTQATTVCSSGTRAWCFGTDGKAAYTDDYGVTWTYLATISSLELDFGTVTAINSVGSKVVVGTKYPGYLASFDTELAAATQEVDLNTSWLASLSDGITGSTIYNNTMYICGNAGQIAKSSNGTTWTEVSGVPTTNQFQDITSTSSLIVAIDSSSNVVTSTDGITWSTASANIAGTSLTSIAWSGERFVTSALGRKIYVCTNSSANSWTLSNSIYNNSNWNSANEITKVIYNNNKFFAFGDGGSCATSTDGVTWTVLTNLSVDANWAGADILDAIYDGLKIVVVGTGGKVATTIDGVTWKMQTALQSTDWGTTDIHTIQKYKDGFLIGGSYGKLCIVT